MNTVATSGPRNVVLWFEARSVRLNRGMWYPRRKSPSAARGAGEARGGRERPRHGRPRGAPGSLPPTSPRIL